MTVRPFEVIPTFPPSRTYSCLSRRTASRPCGTAPRWWRSSWHCREEKAELAQLLAKRFGTISREQFEQIKATVQRGASRASALAAASLATTLSSRQRSLAASPVAAASLATTAVAAAVSTSPLTSALATSVATASIAASSAAALSAASLAAA